MKKLILLSIVVLVLAGCSENEEERYVFEEERILDVETGDEYYLKNRDTMTVVHIDGVAEPVTVTSTPFAESERLEEMMENYEKNLAERKENLLEEQQQIISEQRIERYESYNDEELMDHFNQLHSEDASYEQQMDVVLELLRREVVLKVDVPKLMEIDSAELDYNIEYTPENQ